MREGVRKSTPGLEMGSCYSDVTLLFLQTSRNALRRPRAGEPAAGKVWVCTRLNEQNESTFQAPQ